MPSITLSTALLAAALALATTPLATATELRGAEEERSLGEAPSNTPNVTFTDVAWVMQYKSGCTGAGLPEISVFPSGECVQSLLELNDFSFIFNCAPVPEEPWIRIYSGKNCLSDPIGTCEGGGGGGGATPH